MTTFPRPPSRSPSRPLALAALALFLLLGVVGCELEELFAGVGADVKDAYGVDINDPSQVAGAAATGRTLGETSKADGLDVLRGLRRADYEQKGDQLYKQGDYAGAIEKYRQALRWNEPPPPEGNKDQGILGGILGAVGTVVGKGDPERSAALNWRLGRAYEAQGDQDKRRTSYGRAGEQYEESAAASGITPDERNRRLEQAAVSYLNAGDAARSCAAAQARGWTDFIKLHCP